MQYAKVLEPTVVVGESVLLDRVEAPDEVEAQTCRPGEVDQHATGSWRYSVSTDYLVVVRNFDQG